MLTDQRILVTGVTGAIALPVARFLARENQVFGAARLQGLLRDLLNESAPIRAPRNAAGVAVVVIADAGETLPADLPRSRVAVVSLGVMGRNAMGRNAMGRGAMADAADVVLPAEPLDRELQTTSRLLFQILQLRHSPGENHVC